MNKYQIALNSFVECANEKTCGITTYESIFGEFESIEIMKKSLQELIDKSAPKSNEISMSEETFIDLCRGDIGVMDITGQTLYELTGDFRDYDESLDGDDDEED